MCGHLMTCHFDKLGHACTCVAGYVGRSDLTCGRQVKAPCTEERECADDMQCVAGEEGGDNKVCRCRPGLVPSKQLSCVVWDPAKVLGSECRTVGDCGQGMDCSSVTADISVCLCGSGYTPSADHKSCQPQEPVDGPKCEGDEDCGVKKKCEGPSGARVCRCADGYVTGTDGICGKGRGEACSVSEDQCGDHMNCTGNTEQEVCQCHNTTVAKADSSCGQKSGGGCRVDSDCGDDLKCTGSGWNQKCVCHGTSVARHDGTCGLAFGQPCRTGQECGDYMSCRHSSAVATTVCGCLNHFVHHPDAGDCEMEEKANKALPLSGNVFTTPMWGPVLLLLGLQLLISRLLLPRS
ncbi:hypothetical protein ACOMHN_055023 [Nucella lapillus]